MTIAASCMLRLRATNLPTTFKLVILLFAAATGSYSEALATPVLGTTRDAADLRSRRLDTRTLQTSKGPAPPAVHYRQSGRPQNHSLGHFRVSGDKSTNQQHQRRAALGISDTNSAQEPEMTLRGCMAQSSASGPFSVQQYTEGQPAGFDTSCLLCFPSRIWVMHV